MIFLLILIGTLLVAWFLKESAAAKKRLPGPPQLPLIGSMLSVAVAHPVGFVALAKLSKKYGDAMSIRLGLADYVFVSSYESIKFFYGGEECASRPCAGIWAERNFYKNLGIIFSEGSVWGDVRKFSTQCMRSFGFINKTWSKDILREEIDNLMKHIDKEIDSKPNKVMEFTASGVVKVSFTNLICSVLNGKLHDYDDKKLQNLVNSLDKFFRASTQGMALMTAYPALRFFFGKIIGYQDLIQSVNGVHEYSRGLIAERKRLGIYKTGEPTCFIDAFLLKMEESKNEPNTIFTDDQFLVTIADFFTAGAETTANWLQFAILYMMAHPEKQEKMYKELQKVVGDRLPEVEDKNDLIYTQAVMLEIHRWCSVSINIGPRIAVKDFKYDGYIVKKGTNILGNIFPLFNEREYWGDPDVFRPERFIGEDGKLTKLERMSVIYGLGKRICFGEVLAKDSAFLYLASIIQRYELQLPEEYMGKIPSLKLQEGITTCPVDYKVKMVRRQ